MAVRALALALGASLLAAACTGGGQGQVTRRVTPSFGPPPSVSCPPPVIPGGTYATDIPPSTLPEGGIRAFVAGHWTWNVLGVPDFHCFYLTSLSHLATNGEVDDIEVPFYTVAAPDRVVIHWCCSIPNGTYAVSVQADGVRLEKTHGTEEFAAIVANEVWTRQSGGTQ